MFFFDNEIMIDGCTINAGFERMNALEEQQLTAALLIRCGVHPRLAAQAAADRHPRKVEL